MTPILDFPHFVFVLAFLVLWLSARVSASVRKRRGGLPEGVREDFDVILAATLTLLGLIIGFSFSMAISLYDQRKITKRKRLTPSARNTCAQTCCLPPKQRNCAPC